MQKTSGAAWRRRRSSTGPVPADMDIHEVLRTRTSRQDSPDAATAVFASKRISLRDGAESEKQFMAAVVDLARVLGWSCFHTYLSIRSESGFPDLLLVRPPRLIFAELKSSRGRLSPAQTAWLALLKAVPCAEVHVWRPEDKQRIADVLGDHG